VEQSQGQSKVTILLYMMKSGQSAGALQTSHVATNRLIRPSIRCLVPEYQKSLIWFQDVYKTRFKKVSNSTLKIPKSKLKSKTVARLYNMTSICFHEIRIIRRRFSVETLFNLNFYFY